VVLIVLQRKQPSEAMTKTDNVPVYKLNNGAHMPVVGLGVFHSEPASTVAAVKTAVENGYRLIDTAAAYKNEREVGEGIRSSGIPREEIFVTTKVWISDYGYDRTLRAFDRSLSKLGLDVLDMYMLHWPVPTEFEKTVESYKAALTLLADGRIRTIGVSNFSRADMDNLVAQTGHVPAVNQVELHPFFQQADLLAANADYNIITQAWSPIGGVMRYGANAKNGAGGAKDPLSQPIVASLAEKYRKTPAQVMLRWHIEIGTSPIPKSVRPERIAENFDIFDFALTSDEVKAISTLDTGDRGGPDPAQVSPSTLVFKLDD